LRAEETGAAGARSTPETTRFALQCFPAVLFVSPAASSFRWRTLPRKHRSVSQRFDTRLTPKSTAE
jgi:hypothetical protein